MNNQIERSTIIKVLNFMKELNPTPSELDYIINELDQYENFTFNDLLKFSPSYLVSSIFQKAKTSGFEAHRLISDLRSIVDQLDSLIQ